MQAGTRGNPNAQILIVAESYGVEEERQQQPLVGASGKELDRMLQEAGIDPRACYYTNVVNKRPGNNEMHRLFLSNDDAKSLGISPVRGLYPDVAVLQGIRALDALIKQLQPKVIIGFGNYALWALTENNFNIGNGTMSAKGYKVPTGIGKYRGSQLRTIHGIPFLPTFHPAACLRNWAWRYLVVHDLRARVHQALAGQWSEPERNYIIQPSFERVMGCLTDLRLRAEMGDSPLVLACDIETSGQHLECVGIGWSRRDAICIPFMSSERWDGYWQTRSEEVAVALELKRTLEHPNIRIVGQNFIYDYQHLFRWHGIKSRYWGDTMLAQHLIFPGTEMGLNYISSLYCEFHSYWKDDGKESAKSHDDQRRWIYNARDCVVTYEAHEEEMKLIDHYGLRKQYGIQMLRANAAIQMMLRGTRIDGRRKAEETMRHMEAISEYDARFYNIMPESVWPKPGVNSTKKTKTAPWWRSNSQLADIFYDRLGIQEVRDRKTNNPTVADEALGKIGQREPALLGLCQLLQQYRSLESFGQFIHMRLGSDGRARCTFSPTAETYRYRSGEDVFGTGRNLQNLPKGAEE